MLEVFNHTCKTGEKLFFSIDGPEYANRAKMQIPVILLSGMHEGPTLWINGAVHGDELNGSYGAWELMRELDPCKVRGNIVVTPIANVAAFADHTKTSRIDELDMDTQFPGNASGMLSQRIADMIYLEIKANASYLIHFHTLNTQYDAHPYTVSKCVPGADPSINQKALNMALAFGLKTNCVVDLDKATGELPGVTSGALDITCILDGIPAFMGEIGHGGIIDRKMVDVAKQGLFNLMIYLDMMDGVPQKAQKQYRITKRKFVRTAQGGILDPLVSPEDIVPSGSTIAMLHYFDDAPQPFLVEQDSYLLAVRTYPAVHTGDRVAFLGLEWEEIP